MTNIYNNFLGSQPVTIAVAPDGAAYIADGLARPQRWDGVSTVTEDAGIDAPSAELTVAAGASGSIYGTYYCYYRYLDNDDIPSSLSPVTSIVLTASEAVTALNYTNVANASGVRVAKKQVWRTTHGQNHTVYLDLTINNNTTTTGSSAKTDGELSQQTAMRLYTDDGFPNASRFSVPPDDMSVCAWHRDRMWWAAPVDYTDWTLSTVSGTSVYAASDAFTSDMEGRYLTIGGKARSTIDTVTSATLLSVTTAFATGIGSDEGYWSISVTPKRRNSVFFSEGSEPEALGGVDDDGEILNQIVLPPDDDQIVGLMPLAGYLYILKRRHIYRLSTAGDPRRDASVVLAAERGCVNHRSWCRVEDTAFLMDRAGIYAFDGATVQPISQPIQDLFLGSRINWAWAKYFHAAHSPEDGCVRFFVSMDSETVPKDCLCFDYRQALWWTEDYPFAIGASCGARVEGQWRTLVGADTSPSILNEGVLDGCAASPTQRAEDAGTFDETIRGTVDSAATTSLTDASADLTFTNWFASPADFGAPVMVIDSNGDWQTRQISSVDTSSGKIVVSTAWDTTPSAGDTYQIGGIEWSVKFGAFPYLRDESNSPRDIRVYFEPLSDDASVNVRRYKNHASTPEDFSQGWSADGVTYVGGSPNAQLDLTHASGALEVADAGGFSDRVIADRFLEVELEGVSNSERVQIHAVEVRGCSAGNLAD